MAFTDLSTPLQNLITVNFNFLIKIILLSILFYGCYWWVRKYSPKQKSVFLGVKVMKVSLWVLSLGILLMSPMMLLTLYPKVPIDLFITVMSIAYMLLFSIGGILITLGMIQYGSDYLIDMLGGESDLQEKNRAINLIVGGLRR